VPALAITRSGPPGWVAARRCSSLSSSSQAGSAGSRRRSEAVANMCSYRIEGVGRAGAGAAHAGGAAIVRGPMLRFDDEHSRHLEATYTTPDVVEQRRAVRELLAPQPGERVLDIGAGPGLLAVELAADVGPEGEVH